MTTGAPKRYTSAGYAASGVVSLAPVTLQMASGYNPQLADLFLLFFDTVAVPAAGTVPKYGIRVTAGATFSWAYEDLGNASQEGEPFLVGCCFGVSTTGDVYTPSALGFWVDAYGRLST
jgi:hypothetical protein